jgi:hypothetical protein
MIVVVQQALQLAAHVETMWTSDACAVGRSGILASDIRTVRYKARDTMDKRLISSIRDALHRGAHLQYG